MADEAPAASTTSPLSSPGPSPSSPAAPAAPAAGSTKTPESQATTSQTSRPDGIPDERWDATANALKLTPADYAAERKQFNELATWKAAEDVRKGALPQTPDAYKMELPADFKPPAGVEFKLDTANPALGQLKSVAHKYGLTQAAVNELIGVYAGNEVGTQARIDAGRAAEVAKLGATGPARIDNVVRFLDSSGLGALKSSLITAAQVEAWESHITKLTNQGGASFSQSHRVPPDTNTIPGYDKMSFEQRRLAQDQKRASRATA